MPWTSSWDPPGDRWGSVLRWTHSVWKYRIHYALPMLLALGVVSNITGGRSGKYCWTGAWDFRQGKEKVTWQSGTGYLPSL